MMKVTDLEWQAGSPRLSWRNRERVIAKNYRLPLQSVCVLSEGDGIALVESYRESGPTNAVILDADGSERFRLGLPIPRELMHCYDSMYYIQGQLSAILVSTSGDWLVTVDPHTGRLSEPRETR